MMKRICLLALSLIMLLSMAGCGSSDAADSGQRKNGEKTSAPAQMADKPQTETGKALVVYFSCTGNTKRAAQYASDILGADLYEITPKVPYTSNDLNYHDENTRATVEQKDSSARPAIVGDVVNFEQYDTVVLAFPIWWGQEPRILDTFMESHDFGGKTIVPMCTSNSSDMGSSANYLKAVTKGSAKWLQGKRFPVNATKEDIHSWLNDIGLAK